jgi:hypothetical protein
VDIHDWAIEFTAAGVVMQAEALLIQRDPKAIEQYLPKLRRCIAFIETRRDPKNNLFLAGPAGNLLAPSYAGYKKADGSFDKAYLTGLSVTYIAALDRVIELEKMAGNSDNVRKYTEDRETARKGLAQLTTEEGYLVKSLDPDGVKHGVYGAEKYGYLETVCNHDAVCFRVVDDAQSEKIYAKIASIPGLRPHDLIITNYPSLDDMYVPPTDWLWSFGTWVNGGHWSTCEARMMMAYSRLNHFDDAKRSMQKMLKYAKTFRMDNPLVEFGNAPYQPKEPINCCYDNWAVPAALIRGLFEYLYSAEGLTVFPHIPTGITRLEQHFPVRFGTKQLYFATAGQGPIREVLVNGEPWKTFDARSVFLAYDKMPNQAKIQLLCGDAKAEPFVLRAGDVASPAAMLSEKKKAGKDTNTNANVNAHANERDVTDVTDAKEWAKLPQSEALKAMDMRVAVVRGFLARLVDAGLGDTYEAAHAQLAVAYGKTTIERFQKIAEGQLAKLPETAQAAADNAYVQTTNRLCEGLEKVVASYATSENAQKRRIAEIWSSGQK